MPSQYTFTDYSPTWPDAFNQEAERLTTLLGAELITVHHIGSTSVPGLAAKPIIDLLPLVRSIESIDGLTPKLEQAGYRAWGEYGIAGRRLFTKDRDNYRTHNIHIYQAGNPDIERHLAFCAYLRSHPKIRDEYAALKRAVYAQHPSDIAAYNDGKDAWIKTIEIVALEWYRQQAR
ncbi:MAG: GrpB family protein [Chloroflexales bacterium]|nr:GrpB family protein [Chloroflexales bacterium]